MHSLPRTPAPRRASAALALLAAAACASGDLALPGDGVPASAVAEQGDNQTARVGRALPESLVVRVLDGTGTPLGGVTVEWEAQQGGSVSPSSSVTDDEGRAAAARILGESTGTVRTVARAQGPEEVPVTFTAVATPAPIPLLALAQAPSSTAIVGRPLERQPIVQVRDDEGAPVRQAGIAVAVAIAEGEGRLTGSVTRTTDAEGVAAFTDLAIAGEPGTRRLLFAAEGLASVTSPPIAVEPPPAPAKLVFVVQPSAARVNRDITPPVRVAIADASGRTVPGTSALVTMSIGSGPSRGDLRGTRSAIAVDGVAVFDDLRLDAAGTYTLRATSFGLDGATSAQFDVD
jgi:hypothetical protein